MKAIGATFHPSLTDASQQSVCQYRIPKYVNWLPYDSDEVPDILLFADDSIRNGLELDEVEYGWLFESPGYTRNAVADILNNIEKYKKGYKAIFTSITELLEMGEPFRKVIPQIAPRIYEEERKMYQKSKLVSTVTTIVNTGLPGHAKRIEYINNNHTKIDVYGRGRKELRFAWDGMIDYMFVVMFENVNEDVFIGSHISDCILTGAIPVYWGSSNGVKEYLDERGVLFIDDIKLEDLSKDLYNDMLPYAKINFDKCNKFLVPEDYLVENYFIKQLKGKQNEK